MIHFFLPHESDLRALRELDPDRDWRSFGAGERVWVLSTYLHLRRAGRPVELVGGPPAGARVLVFHAKHERDLLRHGRRVRDTLLLGVRADNREPLAADLEVVQNGRFADGRRRFFVPHWPQPGLVPRDPARGERITRIAYKGLLRHLHPGFRDRDWTAFLAGLGIEWSHGAAEFVAGQPTDPAAGDWPDHRDVDAVLAIRPPDRKLHRDKPASKLVNAWLAGAPAILGPEHAYRELRRSPLDYLEAAGPAEAREAVLALRADSQRYRAMVENGRARGEEFSAARVRKRWEALLFETLPRLERSPLERRLRRLPLSGRRWIRWVARRLAARPAR